MKTVINNRYNDKPSQLVRPAYSGDVRDYEEIKSNKMLLIEFNLCRFAQVEK